MNHTYFTGISFVNKREFIILRIVKIQPENSARQNIYFQLFFWTALFALGAVRNYAEHDQPEIREMLIYDFCHWIFQIAGANFIYGVLIRKYYDHKKYLLFIIYLLLFLYFISVANRLFIIYAAEPFFVDYPQDTVLSIFTDFRYLLFHYTIPVITAAFIFISVMFMLRYKNEKQTHALLRKEKAELELQALKSRLNPHFLFNTLNNIYALSLTDPEKTTASVGRLSDILDYILYKGQNKTVTVLEELNIVDNYIELEKLRYDERLTINVEKQLTTPNTIPPLLYLSLVENAFKHGAAKTRDEVLISISVRTEATGSVFIIENTCPKISEKNKEGIGLENIEEQLKHYYGDHFTFRILHERNKFTAELTTPAHHD